MQRYICLLVGVLLASVAWGAQPGFEQSFYRGTVGTDHGVIAQIAASEGKITGGYSYESKGNPIDLEGTVDESGAFHIKETVNEKETGRFEGTFKDKRKRMEGQWSTPDGKRTMPFTLTRFAIEHSTTKNEQIQGQPLESSQAIPAFEDPSEAKLNEAITAHLDKTYKSFVADLTKNMDPKFKADNSYDVDTDVATYIPGKFVSLVFTISEYTGGAHPMTQFDILNLRLSGGEPRPVALADLFSSEDAAIKAISDYCMGDLKKQKAGFVLDKMVVSLDKKMLRHFSVSQRGIAFLFEPYAVAPYAEGTFEVTVPFSALKSLLKPGALDGIAAL